MLTLPVDPVVRRAALEQQLALLAPVAEDLRAAVTAPPVLGDEWRGPAAETADRFLAELRATLARAEAAADDAVQHLRRRLRELA